MPQNLKPDEAVLFCENIAGYLPNGPTFRAVSLQGRGMADGSLTLTNARLLFCGMLVAPQKIAPHKYRRAGIEDLEIALELGGISAITPCKVGGLWPTGIAVHTKNGKTFYFSLKNRKKLIELYEKEAVKLVFQPEYPYYTLTVDGVPYTNPTAQDIKDYLGNLEPVSGSFLILERSCGIGGTAYLQAALPVEGYDDGLGYCVQVGVPQGQSVLLYEYRTQELDKVRNLFCRYLERQEAPPYFSWNRIEL